MVDVPLKSYSRFYNPIFTTVDGDQKQAGNRHTRNGLTFREQERVESLIFKIKKMQQKNNLHLGVYDAFEIAHMALQHALEFAQSDRVTSLFNANLAVAQRDIDKKE